MAGTNPVKVTKNHSRNEMSNILKEFGSKIDINMAALAVQNPPIDVFLTPNTSHLPYNEQDSMLEPDYLKYYDSMCEGDSSENEMAELDIRIENGALNLDQIFQSVTEYSNQMKKCVLELGQNMPNWDKLSEIELTPSTSSKSTKQIKAATPKVQHEEKTKPKSKPKREQLGKFKKPPTTMTKIQAQMMLAQIMIARSNGKARRVKLPLDYIMACVIEVTNEEPANQE